MESLVLVGTAKGGFLLRSSGARTSWSVEGPIFKGWKVTAAARAPGGETLVATASDIYGTAVQRSPDLESWTPCESSPAWPEGGDRKLNQIWTLVPAGDRIYAGVDVAGLFVSEDGGNTWRGVEGLNEHPTRSAWYPGAGGLCAHSVLVDPADPERLWCGISAVGVFRSEDGGADWKACNEGVTVIIEDEHHKDIGRCVHALRADPADADHIWRQDHRGMYRTTDGGDSWERIENGLPSGFGFPLGLDRQSGALFAVPLESDEFRLPIGGALQVFRSRNGGDSWHSSSRGLPETHSHDTVLRGALDVDDGDPCGVVFGTTSGNVFASADGGDSWQRVPCALPRVLCVRFLGEA